MNWYKKVKAQMHPAVPPQQSQPQQPNWDPICPGCGNYHGFEPDVADADCPHCGAWLTTKRKGGSLELAHPPAEQRSTPEEEYWDQKIDQARDEQNERGF